MYESVLRERPHAADTRATDRVRWDATHLRVRDLDRALAFWRDLLGLQVTGSSPEEVRLGVADADLVVLHPGAVRPTLRGRAGLYHVAFHLPSARSHAEMLARLASRGVDPRPTDHLLHWAMYLNDGDGIGVELAFETADRFDHVVPGRTIMLAGTDGGLHGPVERLDVQPILEAFPALDANLPAPAGTRVGHNHLHVASLDDAAAFYELIGFEPNAPIMDSMSDFNAQGTFLHRLALNEWQGKGAPAAPSDAAGLHHLEVSYAEDGDFQRAVGELERNGDDVHQLDGHLGVRVLDPSGNVVHLSASRGG